MNRRSALRALVAAPVVAKSAGEAIVKSIAETASATQAASLVGLEMASPLPPMGYMGGPAAAKLALLHKAGLLPEWAKREMRSQAEYASRRLDPDLACMRSVSLSAKMKIQQSRIVSMMIDELGISAIWQQQREAFMRDAFGTPQMFNGGPIG